jgi:hypothetical protein
MKKIAMAMALTLTAITLNCSRPESQRIHNEKGEPLDVSLFTDGAPNKYHMNTLGDSAIRIYNQRLNMEMVYINYVNSQSNISEDKNLVDKILVEEGVSSLFSTNHDYNRGDYGRDSLFIFADQDYRSKIKEFTEERIKSLKLDNERIKELVYK